MKNILEKVEQFEDKEKVVLIDSQKELTYKQLVQFSKSGGTYLSQLEGKNRPIAIYLEKSCESVIGMLSVVYSGHFYVMIDDKMPVDRIRNIFDTLEPIAMITDKNHFDKALELIDKVCLIEDMMEYSINVDILNKIRERSIDTDPLYALYTSGSTGVPKGALLTHRNVLNYTDWYIKTFGIGKDTVFGSQTPFYFSMSVSDLFSTLFTGATLVILEKRLFVFPIKLIERMNETKVNTIYWVPSALGLISNMNVLDYVELPYLKTVLFAGEAMPVKYLNYWMDHYPDIVYANLYGPTETTDICTYYVVNRRFENDESLPIGRHCDNTDVFILDENDKEITDRDKQGELCVRGSFLAQGYYNNPEKTKEAFVQNPLNTAYPEMMYRTGDLVKYNEYDEIIYVTRKDYQIKHMGYRIELGEIETAVYGIDAIKSCVVVYDDDKDKIVLIYQGKLDIKEIVEGIKGKLPVYMMPDIYKRVRNMPMNQNGKIDRKYLKGNYGGLK